MRSLQVQKTHDWSELCRVHKRGCQGLGAIEMHSQAAQVPLVLTGLLDRPPSLERSER